MGGHQWKLKRVTVLFRENPVTVSLEGIFAHSATDIWLAGSIPIHGDGVNWIGYDIQTLVGTRATVSRMWGTPTEMSFVGRAGNIIHYANGTWRRVESGTTANLNDIWGTIEQPSGKRTVLFAASNGYGLHVVRVSGGQVQHDLLDNNGVIISGYSSTIASGELPVITSFGGKLRVAVKTSQQPIGLFQSNDGGTSWTTIPNIPSANSDVYDLDSYTDGYGTQIVWATGTEGDVEVYHVSYNDQIPNWTPRFNVTNLSAQEYGYRPKVTATSTEAHVAFIAPDDPRFWSRDLNLQGAWEDSYVTATGSLPLYSANVVTIGDSVYAFFALQPPAEQDNHDYQDFYFTQRHKNDATWRTPAYVTAATYGLRNEYMRNRMVVQNNSLYFLIN